MLCLTTASLVPGAPHSLQPLVMKGLFQEGLVRARLKRMPWNLFKSKEDWGLYMENLKPDQLYWKASWFHIDEAINYDAVGKPLLLFGFRGIKKYSPIKVVR